MFCYRTSKEEWKVSKSCKTITLNLIKLYSFYKDNDKFAGKIFPLSGNSNVWK
jgi:hypothetical protein